jgi:hypothetical protein
MKLTRVAIVVAALALPAGSIAGLVACNAVLGIERATLDAGSDDAGGSDPLTCANYCAVIAQNCTGGNQEYLSNDVCLKACSYMQAGQFYSASTEPPNVDSLGCRLWHAHSAATHPETHCRHAGPLGADLCGGPCGPFCSLVWHFCTDDNGINVYDQQVTGCESVCTGDAGFPYVRGDSGDLVDPGGNMIEMGNTLNCRLWHIETAIEKSLPVPHCGHTARVSATCQ